MKRATSSLSDQLQQQRRTVDFDTYDIHVQQILAMLEKKAIDIAPSYQRQFRWDDVRCSQLVESLFLGIPIPSLFMATNPNSTWELVDGVQRLSAIAKFAGNKDLRSRMALGEPLQLVGLQKLTSFEGQKFSDLPSTLRLHFETRPLKVVTLSDKSDAVVRFDLFERLNTGGIRLTDQEIRDCVYRGRFATELEKLATNTDFRRVVRLTHKQQKDGTREECVLRFFAFFHQYKKFVHSVRDFLNDYMAQATKSFNYTDGGEIFEKTFKLLATAFPKGIGRPGGRTTTPLNLFEGVAVGAALAVKKTGRIRSQGVQSWIGCDELVEFTTGATNNPKAVKGRIEFCRDKFLGK